MNARGLLAAALTCTFLASCSTGQVLNAPAAQLVADTRTTVKLEYLPAPKTPVDVAVYDFPDLTGQAKPNPSFAEYSRAVTQGAAQILIDVLTSAGGGSWFRVAERTGLKNLVQERTLIENTNRAYNGSAAPLPPVRFAGILLEGGIVGYDSDMVTGGAGAKYFGIGGDVQYRSDVVTINLRAVSVTNGAVLLSTTTTKQIYSFQERLGIYTFASPERLLEVDAGFSRNDPGQLAVREAIELAVYSMIVKGLDQHLWELKDPSKVRELIDGYQTGYVDARPVSRAVSGLY